MKRVLSNGESEKFSHIFLEYTRIRPSSSHLSLTLINFQFNQPSVLGIGKNAQLTTAHCVLKCYNPESASCGSRTSALCEKIFI